MNDREEQVPPSTHLLQAVKVHSSRCIESLRIVPVTYLHIINKYVEQVIPWFLFLFTIIIILLIRR